MDHVLYRMVVFILGLLILQFGLLIGLPIYGRLKYKKRLNLGANEEYLEVFEGLFLLMSTAIVIVFFYTIQNNEPLYTIFGAGGIIALLYYCYLLLKK